MVDCGGKSTYFDALDALGTEFSHAPEIGVMRLQFALAFWIAVLSVSDR